MFCVLWDFRNYFKFVEESGRATLPSELGRPSIVKKPETPPAESVLRIAPVRSHELEDLVTRARTRKGEPGIGVHY